MAKKTTTEPKMANVNDPLFLTACDLAGVAPTNRQYRKWKQGNGQARGKAASAQEVLTADNSGPK